MVRNYHPRPLLISCGILQPEIGALIECKEIEADVVFLNKYLHVDYQKLHNALKASILKHRQRSPVVIYGDVCLGFNGEMQTLMTECEAVKVDALKPCSAWRSRHLSIISPSRASGSSPRIM